MSELPSIEEMEIDEEMNDRYTLRTSYYDPVRLGRVIDGVFISDEDIIRGEVLKGEIVND